MLPEDYKALKAMQEEFQKELEKVKAQADGAYRRVRETDALILALTKVEPEDMRVFSPQQGKNYDGEKIEEICREREACEEHCSTLEEKKAFLSRHISTLEGVLSHQNVDSTVDADSAGERKPRIAVDTESGMKPETDRDGGWDPIISADAEQDGKLEANGEVSLLVSWNAESVSKAKPNSEEAGVIGEALKGREKLDSLTEREKEILCQVAEGMLNKEIAASLDISEQTVKNHISNIFQKLDVADRTQAAVFAIKNGLGG